MNVILDNRRQVFTSMSYRFNLGNTRLHAVQPSQRLFFVLQRISIPHAIYMWVLGLFCTCVSLVPKYQTVLTFKSVSCSKFLRTSSVNNLHTNFFKLGLSHKKFLNIDRKMTESEESEREHGQRNLILLIWQWKIFYFLYWELEPFDVCCGSDHHMLMQTFSISKHIDL